MARPLKGSRGRFLLRPLNVIFGAPSHVALLRALAQGAPGMTGREVARTAGVAQRAALAGLERLEGAGIVRRRPAGRAFLYELRTDHVLVRDGLLPLLERESEIRSTVFRRLREAAEKEAVSGWVFGSAARSEESPESDLDVLVLVDSKEQSRAVSDRLSAVCANVLRDFDVRASLTVMMRAEFVRGYRAGRSFMRNVVRDAETFAGKRPEAVIDG